MSRAAVKIATFVACLIAGAAMAPALSAQSVAGGDPHLDRSLMPRPCNTCHEGHGASRSPMLPGPQQKLCLSCHGSSTGASQAIARGELSPAAQPPFLASVLTQPSTHPMSSEAFSRTEPGAVTCSSCHSPHRGSREPGGTVFPGRRKLSPRDPRRFEFELCESCHGSAGVTTQSLTDLSRLFDPNNRSFHPVEAPSVDGAPSIIPALDGREINCTDCHGNDDGSGPRGPHGSGVRHLLRFSYTTVDGSSESKSAYRLCYSCHTREQVLSSTRFPEHKLHVVDERASCATCHNPHGSVSNRALVRFGEETFISGVAPSIKTGVLAFLSDAPGSGTCFLTCHGEDHAPESYGPTPPVPGGLTAGSLALPDASAFPGRSGYTLATPPVPRPVERDAQPPP